MSKRVILPAALRTIRDLKAKADPKFKGGHFGPTCGISHGALCNIEAGRKNASVELIERIAKELDVKVEAISYIASDEAAVA